MCFLGVLRRFEGFGCEFPHEKEESGLERKKMGKNTVSDPFLAVQSDAEPGACI